MAVFPNFPTLFYTSAREIFTLSYASILEKVLLPFRESRVVHYGDPGVPPEANTYTLT